MDDSELRQARARIASACGTLLDVEKMLNAAADAAPGQQVAGRITQALKAITRVRGELEDVGPQQLTPTLDKAVEKESVARAQSEVNSGEYDMQG
jgi:hypothetical protein